MAVNNFADIKKHCSFTSDRISDEILLHVTKGMYTLRLNLPLKILVDRLYFKIETTSWQMVSVGPYRMTSETGITERAHLNFELIIIALYYA